MRHSFSNLLLSKQICHYFRILYISQLLTCMVKYFWKKHFKNQEIKKKTWSFDSRYLASIQSLILLQISYKCHRQVNLIFDHCQIILDHLDTQWSRPSSDYMKSRRISTRIRNPLCINLYIKGHGLYDIFHREINPLDLNLFNFQNIFPYWHRSANTTP